MYHQTTVMFIIFGDFFMVEQIFFSTQVKRGMISSNKLEYMSCLKSYQTTQDRGS